MATKPPNFHASAVSFFHDDDAEVIVLVLAESADGGGRTVEVQRSYEDDDHEIALELSGHCVVLDGGPTAHRCVAAWIVQPDEVALSFTADGAAELGLEGIMVSISSGSSQVAAALAELIDGAPAAEDFTVV